MSVDFYIARLDGNTVHMAYHCECAAEWIRACDLAEERCAPPPARQRCDDCTDVSVNMANTNARAWMDWIGLKEEIPGSIPAQELAELCRVRLRASSVEGEPHARLSAGYFRDRTETILRMCEKAGDRLIAFV